MSWLSDLGRKASNAVGLKGLTLRKAISATAGNIPVVGGVVRNVVDAIEARKNQSASLSWRDQFEIATSTVKQDASTAVQVLSVASQAEQAASSALAWMKNPVTLLAAGGVALLWFSKRRAGR